MAKNYIAKIRENKKDLKLTVIILAAGVGYRTGGECKSLLRIGKESILERQLRLIKKKYGPNADIVIVAGHKNAEIVHNFYGNSRIVTNENFANTNVVYSAYLGLLCNINPNVLLIHGDLIFDYDALPDPSEESFLVVSSDMRKDEIGTLIQNGNVVNMSYDINKKWCHMAHLNKDVLRHFFMYCRMSGHKNHYIYEALNSCISEVGPIKAVECDGHIMEVDTIQHLSEANKYFI